MKSRAWIGVLLLTAGCMSAPTVPVQLPVPPPKAPAPPIGVAAVPPYHQAQISTGNQPCSAGHEENQNVLWQTPGPIAIKSVTIWIGTTYDAGQKIDTRTTVMTSEGYVLAFLGLDHYTFFSGLHQLTKTYTPPMPYTGVIAAQHACALYGSGTAVSLSNVFIEWVDADVSR